MTERDLLRQLKNHGVREVRWPERLHIAFTTAFEWTADRILQALFGATNYRVK